MEFPVKTGAPARQRTECAILPVFDDARLHGATADFDTAARGAIKKLVRGGDALARLGSTSLIHRTQGTAAVRWLLVGCGKRSDFSAKKLTTALAAAVNALRSGGTKEATSYLGYGAGLMEMPPVSNVTPLPHSAIGACFAGAPRYRSTIRRGGSLAP